MRWRAHCSTNNSKPIKAGLTFKPAQPALTTISAFYQDVHHVQRLHERIPVGHKCSPC